MAQRRFKATGVVEPFVSHEMVAELARSFDADHLVGFLGSYAQRSRFLEVKVKPREKRSIRPSPGLVHGTNTKNTWAGGVVATPPRSLSWVRGQWMVPVAALPPGSPLGMEFKFASWIGLDGLGGSQDVLQVGFDSAVTFGPNGVNHANDLWVEWAPMGSHYISGFPFSPGDLIHCFVQLAPASTSRSIITIVNLTVAAHTGIGAATIGGGANAPSGINLQGNCAEWIIEALPPVPFARFLNVGFGDCFAGSADGKMMPVNTGYLINMGENPMQPLAVSVFPGPAQVQVSCTHPPVVA